MAAGSSRAPYLLVLCAAVAALALFAAPHAGATQLYWTTFPADPADPGTVGRANLDGSGANNDFISAPNGACGVAADSGHIYWAAGEGTPGQIGRADVFGGAIDNAFIGTTDRLNCGVAVNASSIFFNNHAIGAIGRANPDGTGVEQTFVTGGDNPQHPAVNSTHLFWSNKDSESVGRATLSGDDVDQELVPTKCEEPSGVAVTDEYVYWANTSCQSIGRAKLSGGGVTEIDQDFIELSEGPCGLAVDGNHIYWGRWGNEVSGGFVGRANLDGSGVDQQFLGTAPYVCGVAVGPDPVPPVTPDTPAQPSTSTQAAPISTLAPKGGFKFKSVSCTKSCRKVLISLEFEGAGSVFAGEARPTGKQRKLLRPRLIKAVTQPVAAGVTTLKLKPTKAGKAKLKKKGKLKVKLSFSFTPSGGTASTLTQKITAKPPKPKKPKAASKPKR